MTVFVTCNLTEIRRKMRALSSEQHFPHYKSMGETFSCKLKMIRSKVKALSSEQHFLYYKSMGKFSSLKGEKLRTNSPIWPEIELFRDCMTVFVTCKFDEDLIKNEVAILGTTFSPL